MSAIKLVYFEGCPNSKHARTLLLTSQVEFEVIKQDELAADDPLRGFSSPTILRDNEIVFGQRLTNNATACSAEKFDAELIRRKLGVDQAGVSRKGALASIGSFGSALTVGLCPVCIPAIGAFLSSVGLGFLTQETILKPMLIALLAVALLGFYWSYVKVHHKTGPLLGGVVMSVALYTGRYIYFGPAINLVLMYGGIAGIVAVSIWNIMLKKNVSCSSCGQAS